MLECQAGIGLPDLLWINGLEMARGCNPMVIILLLLCAISYAYEERIDVHHLPEPGQLMASFRWKTSNAPEQLSSMMSDYQIDSLDFALTIGRWHYDDWGGMPVGSAAPIGAFIQAKPRDRSLWQPFLAHFTNLFGIAYNRGHGMYTAAPQLADAESVQVAVPAEFFCTENLIRCLRVLPCGPDLGIASILNPKRVFASRYHSLQVSIQQETEGTYKMDAALVMVFPWSVWHANDWTLERVFDRSFSAACPLASPVIAIDGVQASSQCIIHSLSIVNAEVGSNQKEWPQVAKLPVPISIRHIIIGTRVLIVGTNLTKGKLQTRISNNSNASRAIVVRQLFPWFMPITLHDMELTLDGAPFFDSKIAFACEVDRRMPAQLELSFDLPSESEVTIRISFRKLLLRIDEYPPDKNRGVDLLYAKAERV